MTRVAAPSAATAVRSLTCHRRTEAWTGRWAHLKALLHAAEVLSPSSCRADRFIKRRVYQEQNVDTYWLVDPEARVVEVWRPGDEAPELVTGTLRWQVTAEAPVLEIPLAGLFADLPPA